jgi:hypothetical protein
MKNLRKHVGKIKSGLIIWALSAMNIETKCVAST